MRKTVKKYFIPHEENEYKPHFLRRTSVAVIGVIITFSFFAALYGNIAVLKTDLLGAVIPRTLIDLANGDRATYALPALKTNSLLEESARRKAEDMAQNGYFAHVSPAGVTPWSWLDQVGYGYIYAGENLAVNFSESTDVNQAWMNSPTHRANILNGKFTEVGIGTAHGYFNGQPTVFVVEMFGRPLPAITVPPVQVAVGSLEAEGAVQGVTTEEPVSDAGPFVVEETETFISVENSQFTEAVEVPTENVVVSPQSTVLDRAVSNPGKTLSLVYSIIAGLVLLALILSVFVEIKRQHPKQALAALLLVVMILSFAMIYQNLFNSQVLVV